MPCNDSKVDRRLHAVPRDPVESAAIALAEHHTGVTLGIDVRPWLDIHKDVREGYRDTVRLVLRAAGVDRIGVWEAALRDISVIGIGTTSAYEDALEMQRLARAALAATAPALPGERRDG